jgi:hypothetical protein
VQATAEFNWRQALRVVLDHGESAPVNRGGGPVARRLRERTNLHVDSLPMVSALRKRLVLFSGRLVGLDKRRICHHSSLDHPERLGA